MKLIYFENIIATEQRLTLVDFYATWSGACKAIDPILERIGLALGDIVNVMRIDICSQSNIEIVRHLNIVSVPTLILFSNKELLWRNSGVVAYERLRNIIRRYSMLRE